MALTLALAGTAVAHPGTHAAAGFGAGLAHPFSGLDHVLAMVALGVFAARQGGRAVVALPVAFVTSMVAGAILGQAGVGVPFAEQGIVLSVLVLGLMIAAPAIPLAGAMTVAGCFALFHGHAHGVEMPSSLPSGGYVAGLVAATLMLHMTGLGLAVALDRRPRRSLVRDRDFT
jgi:urease accessory protein